MATVALRDLRKSYANHEAIKGVTLDVEDREFVVFVGPSGCGKSTLLRMIAGLEEISAGDLLIDGKRVNDVGPAQRELAMVFQSYALYPHMTVADNMGFALKLAGVKTEERNAKVAEAARILQLEPYLQRKPGQLSGGQRQRVAIGRSIVRNPKVFLFDEPLSNLDAALRGQMRIELARLHEQLNATMIYVTHDQVEAMTMADKIVVLQAGVVEQIGSPLELYHHPRNVFVAGFMGSPRMNLLPATVTGADTNGVAISGPGGISVIVPVEPGSLRAGTKVTFGIRPEHLTVDPNGTLNGRAMIAERLGGLTLLHVELQDGTLLVVQTDGADATRLHEPVRLSISAPHAHVFGPDGLSAEHLRRNPLTV
ncbi:ABC transporter ATP-binding protein [Lichenicoccus roseus]|uniref:sn-glycerol-3-phosphate ABC transporter ATP-binding protein UgpC n=1 Tax=Lichenicoccus roseus TaxID=2683649 RepID=A0A5R9JCK3_9PROT|nr:sn-glycerol-3-phosphate ABC transporter ATP-binding protein UgpC [Lichenicoccus roseus]TLU74267.1 sn-glycerol-3-phosphate ABC transporter ATP-binding protein UgpC [Lichenicoccus roseus]